MTQRRNPRSPSFLGITLIILGVLLLLDELGMLDAFEVLQTFWPVLLILLGLKMIFFPKEKSIERPVTARGPSEPPPVQAEEQEHYVYQNRVIGEIRRKIRAQHFVGARYSVTMGDIDLDCREMTLSSGQRTLFLSVVFGDIRVRLPEKVPYLVRASVSAGEVEVGQEHGSGLFVQRTLKSPDFDGATTRLIIVATVVFGEITIW